MVVSNYPIAFSDQLSRSRSRLSAENAEYLKEIHELKVSLDNVNHLKGQLATQLEDTRRRLEDEERVSNSHLVLNAISASREY